MRRIGPSGTRQRSRGTVLIVAMWIVLALTGLVLVFAQAMRVELAESANRVAALKAQATARAAVQFVLSRIDATSGRYVPAADDSFEAVQVGDGYFWLLNPSLDDDATYSFGIRDEASRMSVNRASTEILVRLPGMTAELADAIVDWRDADDTVSPGGAENEYYLLLDDPYYCKNAPFETLEEVLLVKGATADLLYGEDTNRNGVLDANENDADENEPADNRDGHLDRGLYSYLSIYGVERNISASGEPRINVNDAGADGLSELLRGAVGDDRFFQVMDRLRSGRPFANILDFYFKTGLTIEEFTAIADNITTTNSPRLAGLVNVSTAPRAILACLPGLEESDVDAMIARREAGDVALANIAWVAAVLPRAKAVRIGDFITARSYQYSADILAASPDGRAFRRCLVCFNTLTTPPRIVFYKDITRLGWPLDAEVIDSIRAGEAPAPSSGFPMAGGR